MCCGAADEGTLCKWIAPMVLPVTMGALTLDPLLAEMVTGCPEEDPDSRPDAILGHKVDVLAREV